MTDLLNDLGGAEIAYIAELVTFTLADGTVLNYCTGEGSIKLDGVTYSDRGPLPRITDINWKLGVEVDTLKLEVWSLLTDMVESQAVLAAILQGLFDNAMVEVQRVLMATPGNLTAGSIILFTGFVSDIPIINAAHAEMDVKSRKDLLNIPLPYLTYQPGCRWPLYGTGCTLSAAAFAVSGTVSAGSGQLLLNTNLTNVDSYFNQGYITFTTGANTGVTRGVRTYVNAAGQILLFVPLPNAVATGDAFKIYPGCDKQLTTCINTFNNEINFGGMPFTPIPESAV